MSNPFIATPGPAASPPLATVMVDPFFDAIKVNDIRDRLRLGEGVVTHARIVQALEGAILTVLGDIREFVAGQRAAGVATYADFVPGDIGPSSPAHLKLLFERAVTFYAAAELVETHRDISATGDGRLREAADLESPSEYRRMALESVRDVKGVTRVAVALL